MRLRDWGPVVEGYDRVNLIFSSHFRLPLLGCVLSGTISFIRLPRDLGFYAVIKIPERSLPISPGGRGSSLFNLKKGIEHGS